MNVCYKCTFKFHVFEGRNNIHKELCWITCLLEKISLAFNIYSSVTNSYKNPCTVFELNCVKLIA